MTIYRKNVIQRPQFSHYPDVSRKITIEQLDITGSFRYFWIKIVHDFDTSVHCAKSLIGDYIKPKTGDIILKPPFRYIYICGVSKPYRWENNFHLALAPTADIPEGLKPADPYRKVLPNHTAIVNDEKRGVRLKIKGVDELLIPEYSKGDVKSKEGKKKRFYTCRNWRFAISRMGVERGCLVIENQIFFGYKEADRENQIKADLLGISPVGSVRDPFEPTPEYYETYWWEKKGQETEDTLERNRVLRENNEKLYEMMKGKKLVSRHVGFDEWEYRIVDADE